MHLNRLTAVALFIPLSFCCTVLVPTGCKPHAAIPPHLLPISDQQQARAFIDAFFRAYVSDQFDTALAMLCSQDPVSQASARKDMEAGRKQSAQDRITQFHVRSIAPMWIGQEPYYRAEVSFPLPHHTGHLLEAYSIRVRDGCVDGFSSREEDTAMPKSNLPIQPDEEKILLPPFSEPAIPPKTVPPTPVNPDPLIEL